MKYVSIDEQRETWNKNLSDGYGWGNPNDQEAKDYTGLLLGNYKKIKEEYIQKYINDKIILELGCFSGKWTQYFLDAKQIIIVDLFPEAEKETKKKCNNNEKILFYLTQGYELSGIDTNSVDMIFSIDSLVRTEIEVIRLYFKEFKRVLKENGKLCIHLPCIEQGTSKSKHFTNLSLKDIEEIGKDFSNYKINRETVHHGVLFLYGY